MLRYLGLTTACDVAFGIFMLSWLVTRHFLFLCVIKSSFYDARRVIPPVWDPSTGRLMTSEVLTVFQILLMCLQVTGATNSRRKPYSCRLHRSSS